MIADKLLDWVHADYLLPGEILLHYEFQRKLCRTTKSYYFFLVIYAENNNTGICTNRSILLGTSSRK